MPSREMTRSDAVREVVLPARLVSRVEGRLAHTEFETADEWISYALEEVLVRVEAATDDTSATVSEEEVERRLESLGYLNP